MMTTYSDVINRTSSHSSDAKPKEREPTIKENKMKILQTYTKFIPAPRSAG